MEQHQNRFAFISHTTSFSINNKSNAHHERLWHVGTDERDCPEVIQDIDEDTVSLCELANVASIS